MLCVFFFNLVINAKCTVSLSYVNCEQTDFQQLQNSASLGHKIGTCFFSLTS